MFEDDSFFLIHFPLSLGSMCLQLYLCCVILLYSCVISSVSPLKLRYDCRSLVLCFVWASSVALCLYGVAACLSCPLKRYGQCALLLR